MKNPPPAQSPLASQLKHLVFELFRPDILDPDEIDDQAPLFGSDLGLDSLDALELAMSIEEKFGLTIGSRRESLNAFASIKSLEAFIEARGRMCPIASRLVPPAPAGG